MSEFDAVVGVLKKDLTLENLKNKNLLERIRKSFHTIPNGKTFHHLLPDGKPGIFFCSKDRQIYVDCASMTSNNKYGVVEIDLRVYRTQTDPDESYRFETFNIYHSDKKSRDLLKDNGEGSFRAASNYARSCIKRLVNEPAFYKIVQKLSQMKKQAKF